MAALRFGQLKRPNFLLSLTSGGVGHTAPPNSP